MKSQSTISILQNHFRADAGTHTLTSSHKAKKHNLRLISSALSRLVKAGLMSGLTMLSACVGTNNSDDSSGVYAPSTPVGPTLSDSDYETLEWRLNAPYMPYVQDPKYRSPAPYTHMKFYHVEVLSPWRIETKGARHGQLAAALHNHIADKTGDWDLDVKLLDKSPFFDNNEFRNVTLHAGSISLSTLMVAWLETDQWVDMWDRSDTIVSAASSNMVNDENCDQSNITARNQGMFELNDTTIYTTGYNSANNRIHKVSVCSLSDVAVPQIDNLEDFGFISWPLDQEYRQLLIDTRPPEASNAELEEKYNQYVQRDVPKGQYRRSARVNSFASPWLGGMISTGRTKHPTLSSHEVVAALWTSASLSGIKTHNGNPIAYSNNGAGLDYDQHHIGFGVVSIDGFFDSLQRMQNIKNSNPYLQTIPMRLRHDGQISSSSSSEQRYIFNVSQEATNMRMILTGHGRQSSVPNGDFFKVQVIDPTGNTIDTDARIAYDQFTASSSKVFGTKAQGQWQLVVPAEIDIRSVELQLVAVSPNGPIDQHIAETISRQNSSQKLQSSKSSQTTPELDAYTATPGEEKLLKALLAPVKRRGRGLGL